MHVCVSVCACEKMPMGVWMYECIMCILISAIHHICHGGQRQKDAMLDEEMRNKRCVESLNSSFSFFFFSSFQMVRMILYFSISPGDALLQRKEKNALRNLHSCLIYQNYQSGVIMLPSVQSVDRKTSKCRDRSTELF